MVSRGTSADVNRWFGRGWLGLGYLFLYLPIVALVVYSVQRLAAAQRVARASR